MARQATPNTRHVSAVMSPGLYRRLVRQAAKETADQGRTITPSEVIRAALEEYLDLWENATFVPDGEREGPRPAEDRQEAADRQAP